MTDQTQRFVPYRVGEWLPSDQAVLDTWLKEQIEKCEAEEKPLSPAVQQFKQLIENDATVWMWFHQMFTQVPRRPPYNRSPTEKPQVHNYHQMLQLINHVMTTPPPYNDTGLVGFPINAILDWSMGTEAGFAAFIDPKVNAAIKKILNEWGCYLMSPESASVLNKDPGTGWLSDNAMVNIAQALPEFALYDIEHGHDMSPEQAREIFSDMFECDRDAKHWGYNTWDEFFTRRFRPDKRPVAGANDKNVIANACESAPFNVAFDVQLRDRFWIKGQPYSVLHMLDNDPEAWRFAGGSIYQAFLSAKSYHRWNSPVSGKVVKTKVIEGTYYSETPIYGFANPLDPSDPLNVSSFGRQPAQLPDDSAPNESQGYISEVATRGLVLIEADNPKIGLMAFLAIGMAEVSSCDIQVEEGQHIEKGDNLGTFHFGGSTHCLIFRPETRLAFDLHGQQPGINAYNIPVRSRIATVLE